jgi:uncharacterized DUF497 family protein
MEFLWDEDKSRTNLRKHGFDFRDASGVFEGDTITVLDDREEYGEERYITLGLLRDIVVVIVHTEDAGTIRIISMRKATHYEENIYIDQVGN